MIAVLGDLPRRSSQHRHRPDIATRERRAERRIVDGAHALATRREGDLAAVGGDGGLDVVGRVLGEVDRSATARLLDVDLEVAAPIGGVGDRLVVGEKHSIQLAARIDGERREGSHRRQATTPIDRHPARAELEGSEADERRNGHDGRGGGQPRRGRTGAADVGAVARSSSQARSAAL